MNRIPQQVDDPVCPVCENNLRLRHGRHGPFYGCASYPMCTFTRSADAIALAAERPPPKDTVYRNIPNGWKLQATTTRKTLKGRRVNVTRFSYVPSP